MTQPIPRPAVVLLSGGLDSTTAAAIARAEGYALSALTIDYGQRHRAELDAARRVAAALGVLRHWIVPLDLTVFGGSALTDQIDVPKNRALEEMELLVPLTYVPARNTIFLSLALAAAETIRAADIFLGVNAVDYSGYPDCRPEFIEAFQRTANLGTRAGADGTLDFQVHAPLIHMTKADIIRRGMELGVDFALTHTCYDPIAMEQAGGTVGCTPCGCCDACLLRLKGFQEAGLDDPAPYARNPW